jgi:type II secretory pathway pseudopilin PulG
MDRRTIVVALALALAAPGIAAGADRAKEQAEVRNAGQDALQVSPGVWLYQFTGTGLALELTAKGAEYCEDGDLN